MDEQKSIRAKQAENKSAKSTQQDKFNRNEAEVKKLITEHKDSRARSGFKSANEIDEKIAQLRKQVDSGSLKVAEEKKYLSDISQLGRQKKQFDGLDDLQTRIDAKKAENAELKKTFDNPESRALAQKYEDNQKELDEIKAAREGTNKNIDSLKADRERLYNEQQATYANIRKIKDEYYAARKAHKEYEDQLYQQRRERQKAEQDAYHKERRRKVAEERLEEASEPAFLDEIRTAEGLIKHFDPSYGASTEDKGPGEFAASAERTVDESGFKGMKVMKKQEEEFFVGGGGKKKGKSKKSTPATNGASADSGKLSLNMGIIEGLAKVGVDAPSSQADVSNVVEKLKEKLEGWKKEQDIQTQKVCLTSTPILIQERPLNLWQNVEKAKAEIARLEKEADEASASAPADTRRTNKSRKVAQKDTGANVDIDPEGERLQEKDAVADATKEMREAKIEDAETPAVASE